MQADQRSQPASCAPNEPRLGLALSGGGSRAAAFHIGTLRALNELGLGTELDVISTVSGGSVFGGAWMAARRAGATDDVFLGSMAEELGRGFIFRSLQPDIAKALVPGSLFTRTEAIARTFDRVFFDGMSLSQLPERPALCINTTVLETGQVAKFSRDGLSAWGLHASHDGPTHIAPLPDFPLSRAVAASAAFPIGLPPLFVSRSDLPEGTRFTGNLAGARCLSLADGGVLENLGVQTLLRSHRYSTWDIIVSDAGTADRGWAWRGFQGRLRALLISLASGSLLERVITVMNDKQNRWARQQLFLEMEHSWLQSSMNYTYDGPYSPGLVELLSNERAPRRRTVLFARVAQDWSSFFTSVPRWRLLEIADAVGASERDVGALRSEGDVIGFLEDAGTSLARARDHYRKAGGHEGVIVANTVPTGFTALSIATLNQLAAHASWQVHAAHAVYGG